jgi:hypothetical protein
VHISSFMPAAFLPSVLMLAHVVHAAGDQR